MKYIIIFILLYSNLDATNIPTNCKNSQIEYIYDINNSIKEKTLEVTYDNCKKTRAIVFNKKGEILSSIWYDNDGYISLNNSMKNSTFLYEKIKKEYIRKKYLDTNIEKIKIDNEIKKEFEKVLGDYLSLDENSSIIKENISLSQFNFLIVSAKYIQYLDTRGSYALSNMLLTKNLMQLKNSLKNSSSLYKYMMTIKAYNYFLKIINFTKPKSIKNIRGNLLSIYTPFEDYTMEYILDKIFELDIKNMKQNINSAVTKEKNIALLSSFKKNHMEYNKKFKDSLKNNNFDILIKKIELQIESNIKNFSKKPSLYFIKINGLLNIKNEYDIYSKVLNLYKKFKTKSLKK